MAMRSCRGRHVLGEGDHLVGAVAVERDRHGVRLLWGGHGIGDVRTTERHAAVEKDRACVFVAVLVLALEGVGAVAGNDLATILDALGEGLATGAGFLAARADFAKFEFGDLFEGCADVWRIPRVRRRAFARGCRPSPWRAISGSAVPMLLRRFSMTRIA